jgi:hypothetical protein
MFPFFLPTLEYRNKTWSWYNFIQEIRRDAIRVIFANTGALVREKIFPKKKLLESQSRNGSQSSLFTLDTANSQVTQIDTASLKSKKSRIVNLFRRKRAGTAETSSTESSQAMPTTRRTKSEESIIIPIPDNHRSSSTIVDQNEKGRLLFGKFYP